MKRFIGLFALIGLGWALAAPASADARVQIGFDNPGLQVVGYNNNHHRRSFHSRGFAKGNYHRNFNRRGFTNRSYYNRPSLTLNFSNRGYYSRNRGYNRGYNSGYSAGFAGSSCQRVSKRGYWHDRPALIGGRQCIDRDGYAYVIPSSRHLIRYF